MPPNAVVAVIGSINLDLVVRVPAIPRAGQTVLGGDLDRIPGGKGANQAVAAARCGARVMMVGRVGDDPFADALVAGLCAEGVDTRHVAREPGCPSGAALIAVGPLGENAICVAPGANSRVSPADVDAAMDTLRGCGVCLLQLEIPPPAVAHVLARCRESRAITVLDPAPAPPAAWDWLFEADVLSPNQSEAESLLGVTAGSCPDRELAERLHARGARCVVLKCGSRGAVVCDSAGLREWPAFRVHAVDTTAAGDAFTAALGVALAEGRSLDDAIRWANAAGALACTRFGAQPSMPARDEIMRLYQSGC